LQSSERRLDYPLGRVLARLNQATINDEEALYLTVEEALAYEQPELERALAFLKLVAAIPILLLQSLRAGKSQNLGNLLEAHAAAISKRFEQRHAINTSAQSDARRARSSILLRG